MFPSYISSIKPQIILYVDFLALDIFHAAIMVFAFHKVIYILKCIPENKLDWFSGHKRNFLPFLGIVCLARMHLVYKDKLW